MDSADIEIFSQAIGDQLVEKFNSSQPSSSASYVALTEKRYTHKLVDSLNSIEPFSKEYMDIALRIYYDLRGNTGGDYRPETDEISRIDQSLSDIHKSSSPWCFGNLGFISEFLFSWGQIFRYLDLKSGQSVLEYGPGSGQTLLMLARAGIDCFGVDIDPGSLSLLRRQADDLGVSVSTEVNSFGNGFVSRQFDRILFFEAFHHSIDFSDLLIRLHNRLKPGGKIVFCGEPVVQGYDSSIPYPWGPRLDALSIYCIRSRGWMELGFQHNTFVELLWRCGWKVKMYPFPGCFRANVFVAEPIWDGLEMFENYEFGKLGCGWNLPEDKHRWTKGSSKIYLPVSVGRSIDVEVRLSNYLGRSKVVRLVSGASETEMELAPGASNCLIRLSQCKGRELAIETETDTLSEDPRSLGVAVHSFAFSAQKNV